MDGTVSQSTSFGPGWNISATRRTNPHPCFGRVCKYTNFVTDNVQPDEFQTRTSQNERISITYDRNCFQELRTQHAVLFHNTQVVLMCVLAPCIGGVGKSNYVVHVQLAYLLKSMPHVFNTICWGVTPSRYTCQITFMTHTWYNCVDCDGRETLEPGESWENPPKSHFQNISE